MTNRVQDGDSGNFADAVVQIEGIYDSRGDLDPDSVDISFNGILTPGVYRILSFTEAQKRDSTNQFFSGTASANANATFTFTDLAAPEVDFLWITPGGGDFSTTSNWLEDQAPSTGDIAKFDLNNTYTVSFNSGVTNDSVQVTKGAITFDLNSNQYTLNGADASMLIKNASLTILDGEVQGTSGAFLGKASENFVGSLTVGQGGQLTVSKVEMDSPSDFSEFTVKDGGVANPTSQVNVIGGFVLVENGGKLTIGQTSILGVSGGGLDARFEAE